MPTDPFVILGISRDATQSEIEEAYKAKREYYQAHIFDDGEAGANAARMLEQLQNAYNDALEMCHDRATVTGDGESSYSDVKQALRDKDAIKAQAALDRMSNRDAEWHYYQSAVFYLKNWLNDSKKQLEIALQLDPGNEKYLKTLENVKKKINGANPYDREGSAGVYGSPNPAATSRSYTQSSPDATDGCCAACQALWCADCCCECLGGDLIRCC